MSRREVVAIELGVSHMVGSRDVSISVELVEAGDTIWI